MSKGSKFKFHAEDRTEWHRRDRAPFGKPAVARSTWETWADDAQSERSVMVAEFHVWIVKTRFTVERDMGSCEAHLNSIAPFASAGMEDAASPQEVPMVVLEFASSALRLMDLKRKIALLNVYYQRAASDDPEDFLSIEPGNEAEINDLWSWFIEERGKEKK